MALLDRLKKSVKRKKAETKAKRNKRQRRRESRRSKTRQKVSDVKEIGSDVGDIFGATRAGGAARGASKAAKATARGAEKGLGAVGGGLDKLDAPERAGPDFGMGGGRAGAGSVTQQVDRGDITVAEIKNRVKRINNTGTLQAMLRAERAGKNRVTAIEAIQRRLDQLQGGGVGVPDMGFDIGPPESGRKNKKRSTRTGFEVGPPDDDFF